MVDLLLDPSCCFCCLSVARSVSSFNYKIRGNDVQWTRLNGYGLRTDIICGFREIADLDTQLCLVSVAL